MSRKNLPAQRRSTVKHSQPEHQIVSLVEHGEVKDDPTKHPALAGSEQKPTSNESSIALDGSDGCTDYAPACGEDW